MRELASLVLCSADVKAQALCLSTYTASIATIFARLEGRKETAEEVLYLKVNIIGNAQRQQDDVINDIFDRRVEGEKGINRSNLDRIESGYQICREMVSEN